MTEGKLSAATKRAMQYPGGGGEWFCEFRYTPVTGLGYEVGVHRRDPSSVIRVGGLYYVYYTRSEGPCFGVDARHRPDYKMWPWDDAEIWYATSPDGFNWQERGCAVPHGSMGAFDERTVCTPDVLAHDGKYYLVYQTAKDPYINGNEYAGMAIADSPDGPWHKLPEPIFVPVDVGYFFGKDSDSYNSGLFGACVHDPILLYYRDRFCLYYKWAGIRPEPGSGYAKYMNKFAGRDTRWAVAFSARPEGPYIPSEYNPITNSGHETLVWPYNGGIAALIANDGPERNTIQWAADGINFEIKAKVSNTPPAGGTFRVDDPDAYPLKGLSWGLCHEAESFTDWNYILRFDTDPH